MWDTSLCRQVTEEQQAPLVWASSTAPLSWRTLGAWSPPHQPTATCSTAGGGWVHPTTHPRLLAVGDESGEGHLLLHPASLPSSKSHRHSAHTSPVTRWARP